MLFENKKGKTLYKQTSWKHFFCPLKNYFALFGPPLTSMCLSLPSTHHRTHFTYSSPIVRSPQDDDFARNRPVKQLNIIRVSQPLNTLLAPSSPLQTIEFTHSNTFHTEPETERPQLSPGDSLLPVPVYRWNHFQARFSPHRILSGLSSQTEFISIPLLLSFAR